MITKITTRIEHEVFLDIMSPSQGTLWKSINPLSKHTIRISVYLRIGKNDYPLFAQPTLFSPELRKYPKFTIIIAEGELKYEIQKPFDTNDVFIIAFEEYFSEIPPPTATDLFSLRASAEHKDFLEICEHRAGAPITFSYLAGKDLDKAKELVRQLNNAHRPNIEMKYGDLYVCWNDHEKGAACQFELAIKNIFGETSQRGDVDGDETH